MSTPFAVAQGTPPAEESSAFTPVNLALGLAALGTLCGIAGIVTAVRAAKLATHAAQEAGAARARATQGGSGATADDLAQAERMWTSKFAALEAQLQNGTRGGLASTATSTLSRPPTRDVTSGGDLGARVIELEKTVAGLSVQLQQQTRRLPVAAAASEPQWPACLTAETTAMQDVRSALSQAVKAREPAAKEVLDKLRAAEGWEKTRPGTSELATSLVDISTLLLTAVRKGAAVAPLDGALLSDRVLAAVRPLWKPIHPELDCRSFYPGTTFDPEWMEDHTRSSLRRPVISEMLSWAVFEKTDNSRRLLAKARVTAD